MGQPSGPPPNSEVIQSSSDRQLADLLYLQRYVLAETFLDAESGVLDYGCDGAFGGALLSAKAAHVTGICATAPEAEVLSSAHQRLGNVTYFDLSVVPTLGTHAFDLITCFDAETAGDLASGQALLFEFERLLKPGGTILLSVPGRDVELAERLESWLRKRFRWVDCFQQRGQTSGLLTPWRGSASRAGSSATAALRSLTYQEGRPGTSASPDGPVASIILIATGRPRPTPPASVLFFSPDQSLAKAEHELLVRRQQAAAEAEIARLQTGLTKLVDASGPARAAAAAELSAELDAVLARVGSLFEQAPESGPANDADRLAQLRQLQEQNRLLERHNRLLAEAAAGSPGSGQPVARGR